jgi:hypothetical protein
MVAVVVAGLGLLGTGVRGIAGVDARLSDAAEQAPVREIDVRQEIRAPEDCPWKERRYEPPPRDELRL